MNLQSERMGKAARISLDGELTIYSVAEIKAGLAEAMNSADQIEIGQGGELHQSSAIGAALD